MPKFQEIRQQLKAAFAERNAVIDGLLTALLAGQHVLLLGPPGTAKSLLASKFSTAVAGGSFFQWLLTKFSSPEEIFGPISFDGLKNDKFVRVTTNKLPESKIVFLDEIFKANSSILNSLLTALNEGLFFNGDKVEKLPMQLCIGASNEYPEEGLEALFDRFMFKFWIGPIANRDSLKSLLMAGVGEVLATLTDSELQALKDRVDAVQWGEREVDTLLNIKAALEEENMFASDRTWVNCIKILKATAVLEDRDHVLGSDFMVLADVLWDKHEDRAKLISLIGNASDPYAARAQAISDALKTAIREIPGLSILTSKQVDSSEFVKRCAPVKVKLAELETMVKDLNADDNKAVKEIADRIKATQADLTKTLRKALDLL